MNAEKAVALVRRYALLQSVICQRRRLYGRLFDNCEEPAHEGDVVVGSGCISAIREASREGGIKYGPDGESNWHQVLHDLEVCRSCRLGLRVRDRIRNRLLKRRASTLAAMRRLGSKP